MWILFFILSPILDASEILRVGATQKVIAISHDYTGRWLRGDRACVYQQERELVCGEVIKTTDAVAILRLDQENQDIARGDIIKRKVKSRRPSALINSVEVRPEAADHGSVDFGITGGLSAGLNYFFPMLHFQYVASLNLVFGVMPFYFRAATTDATIGALGGYFTVQVFPTEPFQGLWLQAGGGALAFSLSSATLEEKSTSPAGFATIGWRGRFEEHMTMGIGAGGQYIRDPSFQSVALRSVNLQPLIILDIGFVF